VDTLCRPEPHPPKAGSDKRKSLRVWNYNQSVAVLLSVCVTISTLGLDACRKTEAPPPATTAQAQQAPQTTYAVPTADQLYQLVAPIALFPDNLVAQVLAASTFPDEITAANTWMTQNASLKGAQLMQAADQQPWDASVKAMTQFPDVLSQMASSLSWTSALGDAYFNIPQSVMNAIQVMRQRAQQAGNLKSNQQQSVSVENQAPGKAPAAPASSGEPQTTIVQAPPQTIVIQSAQPDVVYVPTYNPTAVYGAPVAAYPGYSTGAVVATGLISFGLGIAVGAAISGGGCCGWGYNSWGCGWNNSTVVYNRNTYVSNSNTFANRNNYYNRNNVNRANFNNANLNRNNVNRGNFSQANLNRNNLNRNNVNRNNVNPNNRANNFNNNRAGGIQEPRFNQKYNQSQFNNRNPGTDNRGNIGQNNRGNIGQNNRQQSAGNNRPNFNQQNGARPGASGAGRSPNVAQNQSRPNNLGQSQRDPSRGFGQQADRGTSNNALSNYGQGGNARTNSARGQQSLAARPSGGGSGGGGGARSQPQRSAPARGGGGKRR
jgi:hypothetical protein